jgi:hypothetical protein
VKAFAQPHPMAVIMRLFGWFGLFRWIAAVCGHRCQLSNRLCTADVVTAGADTITCDVIEPVRAIDVQQQPGSTQK